MIDVNKTQTVWKTLEAAVQAMPDRVGFIYQNKEISFREMDKISNQVASGLLKMGCKKGDRIGIIALNQPEWLYTYFAAAKIGLAIVGLSVRYRDVELDYMINHSGAKILLAPTKFGDMDYEKFLGDFRKKIPGVKDFIFIGGSGFSGSHNFEDLMNSEVDLPILEKAKGEVTPEDLLMIIYTSGVTGKPKGAMITHKSQLASAFAQSVHTKAKADDVMIVAMPLNHVGGITCQILANLFGKGTSVLIPMFNPDEVNKLATKYQPTIHVAVPTMHILLMMKDSFATWNREKVRIVITGGSNAEPDLLRKIKEAFPNATVMNLYGLSESSGAVIMSPWETDFDAMVRSIGKPIGNFKVKVVDSNDKDLPEGETGELCIKGDAVVKSYLKMEKETEEAFKQGWLYTGDMAYIDQNGYVTLMGRKKEMYIQGGFNVFPIEVENVLTKHPKILMAAGIGVPDSILGEVGRYYIVPKPGMELAEKEIKDYCRQHMADYKVPKQVVFRTELPLSTAGKIMKTKLKEEFEKTAK